MAGLSAADSPGKLAVGGVAEGRHKGDLVGSAGIPSPLSSVCLIPRLWSSFPKRMQAHPLSSGVALHPCHALNIPPHPACHA